MSTRFCICASEQCRLYGCQIERETRGHQPQATRPYTWGEPVVPFTLPKPQPLTFGFCVPEEKHCYCRTGNARLEPTAGGFTTIKHVRCCHCGHEKAKP